MISIIASSLQISGALILLLNSFGSDRERVLAILYSTISSVRSDEDGMVTITKEKLRKATKQLYMNRIAFLYISIGFLLEIIIAPNPEIPILTKLCYSIMCSVVLLAMGFIASCILAYCSFPEDIKRTYEGLKEETQDDILTNIPKKDIDNILSGK